MAEGASAPVASPAGRSQGGMVQRILRRFARVKGSQAVVEAALAAGDEAGEPMGASQRSMLLKAVRFDTLRVVDVMKPRASIIAIDAQANLAEAAKLFVESQHSRLPIYRETLDDPIGFVHVKDVLTLLAPDDHGHPQGKPGDRPLTRLKREILFVPPSMRLQTLLLKMQSSRIHLALVVDEYGGTDGLVSIEDLVEQIVGDIADEHDEAAELLAVRAGGVLEVDAGADLTLVEEALGASLALPDHEDQFDTVGGLAAALFGRVPVRGELKRHPAGFDIEVLDADPRRVKRVRVKPASLPAGEGGTA